MKVSVHSNDPRVWTALEAAVEDLKPAFSLEKMKEWRPGSPLLLWDYEPGEEIPRPQDGAAPGVVFFARRQQVAQLEEELRGAPASILLKPLHAVALRSMLTHRRDAAGGGAGREDLLQYMLQANFKLQEFDQDRTNFLARAVHDFRAPLTALHGYCGLLLQQQVGALNPSQTELLERMQHSVKRLSRMAAGMFELSVGKQVERKPRLEAVDVERCVQQALHDVLPLADEKQIAVSVQIEPPATAPRWEGAQIEQVLVNLFENACKFTPRFGAIEVRGAEATMHAEAGVAGGAGIPGGARGGIPAYRIDVRDTGSGVQREFLPLIFEEYTSYSGGKDRSGGGLGLAICRMIVTAHGGNIWAASPEDGCGATFSFVLPLYEPAFHLTPRNNGAASHPAAAARAAVAAIV